MVAKTTECFDSIGEITSELHIQDCSKHCRNVQEPLFFKMVYAELIHVMCSTALLLMLSIALPYKSHILVPTVQSV